jgi:hypothetical protein
VETLSSAAGSSRTTVDYWTPFGSASANVDLARDWGLRGTYRRSTIVIPEVTTESFVSDAVSVGTDALLGSRFDFDISAALSTGTSAVATGSNATYRSGTYAASCRWAFTRGFAAIFNYYYYDYRFTNTPDLPEGFPPVSQRHAFRAGVTIWLPLVGGYIDTRTASNTGRP